MSILLAILTSLIIMGVISFVTFFVVKKVSNNLIKYIPSIAAAFGILFFYIKINFIPYFFNTYAVIFDMVVIILLSIMCGVSLLGAIIVELVNKSYFK
jgi:hypothetical protein